MGEPDEAPAEPGTTGRYVVTIDPTATRRGLDVLDQQAGVSADAIAEGAEGIAASQLDNPELSVLFSDLGILIAGGLSPQQVSIVRALTEEDNPILAIEPERVYGALHSSLDSTLE